MKYFRYFLILLLIPFMVLAEECDVSNITITSMKPNKIEGNTEVISDPTFEDRTIILNLKMYDVEDSITYDMTIKNDSEEDYIIDEDTFKTDSEYIEYSLKTKDNTNVVKANSSKEVSLIVTYKKEVEDDKLTNNKFNASNTLKISLNTSEKEQSLDIITTDNIKESLDPEEVENPVTSVSSIRLLSFVLLTTIIIVCLNMKYKKRYGKFFLLIMSLSLISTVYAICKSEIEVESHIEIEKKDLLYDKVVSYASGDNACVTKYTGTVTDKVGDPVQAKNVYFDRCIDKRNVIFGGYCWQVIRTTDTKGTKLIYNGEPVDGKCESNRENHKGTEYGHETSTRYYSSYTFGSSYSYDKENNTFILEDTFETKFGYTYNENLIHKYTCINGTGRCSSLFYVERFNSTKSQYELRKVSYKDVKYSIIGNAPFNYSDDEFYYIGYMLKKKYYEKELRNIDYLFGSTFTYDEATNTYELAGTTQRINHFTFFGTSSDSYKTHYTCLNTTGVCEELYFVHRAWGSGLTYYTLSNGDDISDIMYEELEADDTNADDSEVKYYVDFWYKNNMTNYTDKLEDTVFCNNREIIDLAGFNPDNGNAGQVLKYINYNNGVSFADARKEISCSRKLDQFSVSNNKAKLTYPVGLITSEELYNLGDGEAGNNLRSTGSFYLTLSPSNEGSIGVVNTAGEVSRHNSFSDFGIRPSISLINGMYIESGSGSETDPWIIK